MTATSEQLYVTDAELAAKVGVDLEMLGTFLRQIDRNRTAGFPKQDPLFGGRRYWPAIKDWFDMYNRRRPQEERKSA